MREVRTADAHLMPVPAQRCRLHDDLVTEPPEPSRHRRGPRLDDRERFTLAAGDNQVALLDDGGLLSRDLSNGVAEVLLMVEVDVGDHGDAEVERVRRVEPSA